MNEELLETIKDTADEVWNEKQNAETRKEQLEDQLNNVLAELESLQSDLEELQDEIQDIGAKGLQVLEQGEDEVVDSDEWQELEDNINEMDDIEQDVEQMLNGVHGAIYEISESY